MHAGNFDAVNFQRCEPYWAKFHKLHSKCTLKLLSKSMARITWNQFLSRFKITKGGIASNKLKVGDSCSESNRTIIDIITAVQFHGRNC